MELLSIILILLVIFVGIIHVFGRCDRACDKTKNTLTPAQVAAQHTPCWESCCLLRLDRNIKTLNILFFFWLQCIVATLVRCVPCTLREGSQEWHLVFLFAVLNQKINKYSLKV